MLTVALLFVLFDKKTMELFINVNCFVIRATTHLMGVWIIIEVSYLSMKEREREEYGVVMVLILFNFVFCDHREDTNGMRYIATTDQIVVRLIIV